MSIRDDFEKALQDELSPNQPTFLGLIDKFLDYLTDMIAPVFFGSAVLINNETGESRHELYSGVARSREEAIGTIHIAITAKFPGWSICSVKVCDQPFLALEMPKGVATFCPVCGREGGDCANVVECMKRASGEKA